MFMLNPQVPSKDAGEMRRHMDHVHELYRATDDQIIQIARGCPLDIAVDLKGYTQGARPSVFAAGVAPVQVNYLGYPGSLGSKAWGYIVADRIVIPPDLRHHYDESVIFLPDCYQPNDGALPLGPARDTREDHGLPSDATVLCYFNASYKIGPREFALWAEILRRQSRAVLWLLDSNAWFRDAMTRAAGKEGIDPARLIFAPRLDQQSHLDRHRHADLFLDCFNVNAHTTAIDALRVGLPVLTLPGKQFAAGVGASLLHAAGLPDLVASSEMDYLDRACALIADADRLDRLRDRLMGALEGRPLFKPDRYAAALEFAFIAIHEQHQTGLPPTDLIAEKDPGSIVTQASF